MKILIETEELLKMNFLNVIELSDEEAKDMLNNWESSTLPPEVHLSRVQERMQSGPVELKNAIIRSIRKF